MNIGGRILAHGSALLAPVLYLQGIYIRSRIKGLPEAAGPRQGSVPGDAQTLRLLVLGESTAAGVGADDHQRALTGQVADNLNAMTGATVTWQVHAANGMTAAGLRASLQQTRDNGRADLIVIALGANDIFRFHGPGKWQRDLHALIDTVREQFGFGPVMLSAMPPVGQFPALPQPLRGVLGLRAQLLDHASATLARGKTGVHFVPLFGAEDPAQLFCPDGIHPSVACYALWGRHLAATAVDRLPKRA